MEGWAPNIYTSETRAILPQEVRGLSYTGGNALDSKGKGDLGNVGSHSGDGRKWVACPGDKGTVEGQSGEVKGLWK